jgi:hypothetical protein
MFNKIKLLIILCFIHSVSHANFYANETIYKDEIRGGISGIVLDELSNNGRLVFHFKERVIEFQFRNIVHIPGLHISNPKALQWPIVKSNIFSIRFDPNIKKIISNARLLKESIAVWPPCQHDDCRNSGVPKIIESARGTIYDGRKPDDRYYNVLRLNQTQEEFNKFYLLYQGSNRIILEIDNHQYIFNLKN